MAGPFDHIHIKRNTHGSSNELSFDVLEAAKDDAASSRGKQPTVMISAREGQGSYHGVSGSSTLSGQEEVERRKRRRRVRLVLTWLVAATVAVAAVGAVSYSAWRHHLDMQTFDERFDSLVERLVEVDDFLSGVDTLMADPVSEDGAPARVSAVEGMAQARADLQSISVDASASAPLSMDEQDSTALAQVAEACAAREDMIDAAESAFGVSGLMEGAAARMESAWNDVLASDQAARDASQHANRASTEQDISDARDETQAAQGLLKANLEAIQQIAQDNPRLNLALHIEYLQTRIDSLEYAMATADALIAGDREKAAEQNDRYNEKDAQAVKIAESLPLSPDSIVEESFDPELAGYVDDYEQARNRAIAADALIRSRIAG